MYKASFLHLETINELDSLSVCFNKYKLLIFIACRVLEHRGREKEKPDIYGKKIDKMEHGDGKLGKFNSGLCTTTEKLGK